MDFNVSSLIDSRNIFSIDSSTLSMKGLRFFDACSTGDIGSLEENYTNEDNSFHKGLRVAVMNKNNDLILMILGGGIEKHTLTKIDIKILFIQTIASDNSEILESIMDIKGELAITHQDILGVKKLILEIGGRDHVTRYYKIERDVRLATQSKQLLETNFEKSKKDLEEARERLHSAKISFESAKEAFDLAKSALESSGNHVASASSSFTS